MGTLQSAADQALRPLPGTTSSLHGDDPLHTDIDNLLSIREVQAPKAFEQAYGSLRRGGTLVFVGLPADNHIQLPIFETVLNGTKVLGSIVGARIYLAEVFELHAAGKTHVVYERRQLEDVNSAIREVETGLVKARLVLTSSRAIGCRAPRPHPRPRCR